jgi:hypothetical protein
MESLYSRLHLPSTLLYSCSDFIIAGIAAVLSRYEQMPAEAHSHAYRLSQLPPEEAQVR